MTAMAADLDRITAERIRDEFTKLLCGADPVTGLRLLVDTGLADRFLPELAGLKLEIDEHAQHKDVYEHTLIVVANAVRLEGAEGPDFVLRMAALMHDVGKPATKAVGPDGRVSFHHHEVVGARMTKAADEGDASYPKDVIAEVVELVALHLRFYGYGRGEWTDSAVRRYVTDAGDLLSRLHKLTRSDVTTRNRRKAAQLAADYDALEERIARIAAEEDLARVRPDLDGNAIMELLGVPPGPVVGRAWRHLKDLRLERGPLDRDEAEAELLRWARAEGIVGSNDSGRIWSLRSRACSRTPAPLAFLPGADRGPLGAARSCWSVRSSWCRRRGPAGAPRRRARSATGRWSSYREAVPVPSLPDPVTFVGGDAGDDPAAARGRHG